MSRLRDRWTKSIRVADYKRGKTTSLKEAQYFFGQRLQLPIYVRRPSVVEKPIAAGLSTMDRGFDRLWREHSDELDKDDNEDKWDDLLRQVTDPGWAILCDIRQGAVPWSRDDDGNRGLARFAGCGRCGGGERRVKEMRVEGGESGGN